MTANQPYQGFFEEDDDDLDYLINESIQNEKEKVVGLDDYMNQKESTLKKKTLDLNEFEDTMFEDSFNSLDNDFNESLFETTLQSTSLDYPESPPSVTQALDYMNISDSLPSEPPKEKPVSQERDFTQIPTTGAFVTAVCPTTGKEFYFSKKSSADKRKQMKNLVNDIISKKGSQHGLLSTPIWKLRQEIEQKNKEELKKIEEEIRNEKTNSKKNKKVTVDSDKLWVDKYRPKNYMDLMGDQRLNRDVLKWVKQWDYCVFKKKPLNESQRDQQLRQYRNTFKTEPNSRFNYKQTEKNDDPLLRPEKKILLLSGPPGFGKTTLAHVIAKQVGYNVIEINASDDRTGEVVTSKIKAALEMQAIIRNADQTEDGKMVMTQKPNLLIIDEIDGASSGGGSESFIKKLVDLALAEPKNDKNKKGKKKNETPLLRPIICICNDAYAPVLRPLRMIAKHVQFKKIPMMTIAKRLQDICDIEGLDTDQRTLSLLSETTQGDLRSCLNSLQFIKGKSSSFTREMLSEVGEKDMGKSLFTLWEDLFQAPNAKNKTHLNKDDFDNNRYVDRFYNDIMSNGEFDRIMQGCFEAYPNMRFHDVAFQKFCQMSEWLNFYDQINYRANYRHEYEVFKYLPFPIVNFHRFFAGTTSQDHKVEYPRVEYEMFSTKKTYENLIDIFMAGIHPQRRRYLTKNTIVNELVPLLMHIISPDIKSANIQLNKPAEKAQIARLVDIMIEFGLSFLQEKNEDGQFIFKLEPPVEQLLEFKLSSPKSILPKTYAVRQMIAHEIETEILRKREENLRKLNQGVKRKAEPEKTEERRPKKVKEKQFSLDFFGQTIVPNLEKPSKKIEVDAPKTSVQYKYHEGFSNAVRKPMTVGMFL